ncbi:MAG TPA: helix-turn-helix transcriptional regulator [Leptospiraceae bacterium]|jgi:DNA-binding XRE family transcriptional regulator|nr:helix-turn-helix transcriptional regulator [Leptospiraceae bacterium]HNJ02648.1 helix-turn-helix transcriptional regulator [Leptospiraceae bacterium]HNN76155.1 helix-turn-helix transcriptional regulator [Leptospiraceae bacterium]HQI17788.1 helix-turn-helix transcriptional regulator [Leptospiraceae bacterium]
MILLVKATRLEDKMAAHLAENVKRLRTKDGISQTELAKKVGIHLTHMNRIEKGKYLPSLDTVARLADVFETSIDALVNGPNKNGEVRLEDQSFAERIKLLNDLEPKEKEAFNLFLDTMVSWKKMRNVVSELAAK